MVQDQMRRFLPLPDYDLSDPGEVKLTIHGAVIDESYSQLLMVRTDLPIEDVLALDRVQKKLPIRAEAVAHLRKAKLIEGRKPHLRIAEAIAGATDRLADYVRTRPQTDAHYAALVVDFLQRNGSASRADVDAVLVSLLPEMLTAQQKRNKVANLLSKLRAEGTIRNAGTRSHPRWELS